MNKVTLLLGSNMGDRSAQLSLASNYLKEELGAVIINSSVYETASWGREDLPAHYNQAIQVATTYTPREVLNIVQSIENKMGRSRAERWGERIIDIDIIFYNDEIIETKSLSVPHPRLADRRFALIPLVEIMPEYLHPILGLNMQTLLEQTTDTLSVKKIQSGNN